MIDQLKIWVSSKSWFWALRTKLHKIGFFFDRIVYRRTDLVTRGKTNARLIGAFAWGGVKSLFWVVLILIALNYVERYAGSRSPWLQQVSAADQAFNIEQLRLYAQLLTAIFSIYFATIGIILSSGYTRLRSDIIQMLTKEQVGSMYSSILVFTTIYCLVATALPSFKYEVGQLVYVFGSILTLSSVLALFPLGHRLFNFFNLTQLVSSEIAPLIDRHIKGAANTKKSNAISNHHSKLARHYLEQVFYIDAHVKADKDELENNLPALTNDYMYLLLNYLQKKHTIDHESYWFPRRSTYKQWFLAGDDATSMALQTRDQRLLIEERVDHQWFESEVVDRLVAHIELAFKVGDFDLALTLIGRFSSRISVYAKQFHFDIGIKELKRIKAIIEDAFATPADVASDKIAKMKIRIADTWAVLGSNLCFESLRRMITFEAELKLFFDADEWSEKSLRRLPAFLQVELALIVKRIEFEQQIEGRRLSKPKYVQQLAIQKLLQHYEKVLPAVCDFYQQMLPDFVNSLTNLKMSVAATQVVLASLHNHSKLPTWFTSLDQLMDRYQVYRHYTDERFALPVIDIKEIFKQLDSTQADAIAKLGSGEMVNHIFESKKDDEFPDHFGQIYFELAEACISALEKNDETMLYKVLPMFFTLAFLAADSKFLDPSLEVNDEFRFHLISSVINDCASVLGFAILYGAYFDNDKLPEYTLSKFENFMGSVSDRQQYLKRMVVMSNLRGFSMSVSPRDIIRFNWKQSFLRCARNDGYGDQIRRVKSHKNKIVRAFLGSHSNASHLFFAKYVVPQLEVIDIDIDYHVSALDRELRESAEGV